MIRPSPFRSPEFLRTVNHAPYDYQGDMAGLRHREHEATYRFHAAQAREEQRSRGIVCAVMFAVCLIAVLCLVLAR